MKFNRSRKSQSIRRNLSWRDEWRAQRNDAQDWRHL